MNNTPYYKDPSVKAAGIVENYSQEQVQEYIRCSQDPIYFIEKYIQVNTIDKGLVPLNLRPYQKNIVESVHNNRHSVILSGRQSGKCLSINSNIRLRNKKTGEIMECSIGDFYAKAKNKELPELQ